MVSSPSSSAPASSFRRPQAEGLYDPALDHDACGVAFVATATPAPGSDSATKSPFAIGTPAISVSSVTVLTTPECTMVSQRSSSSTAAAC